MEKKKPQKPKLRNVWEIDPTVKIHRQREENDRHRTKEKLRKGTWDEDEE